jgi:hypothetical protein
MEPNPVQATADAALVRDVLRAHGRSFRRFDLTNRLLSGGAAFLLFPLFVVMLDHATRGGLPRIVIAGVGLSWGVAAVAGVCVGWARSRRMRSDRFLAHDLEHVHGVRHNLLINAVDVHDDPAYPYASQKADQQTAAALREPLPPAPVRLVPGRRTWIVLAVVAAWIGYAWVAGKPVWPSVARFLGLDLAAPTATRLKLIAPAVGRPLYRDQPLVVEVAVFGAPADNIVFERLPGRSSSNDSSVMYVMTPAEADDGQPVRRLTLAPNELPDVLSYRIRGGDAVVRGQFELHERPRLVGWRVELSPPVYTGRDKFTSEAEEIEVIAGTRASFTAIAAAAMHDPIFVLRTDTQDVRTRMTKDGADATHASVAVQLTASGRYRAIFGDAWGRQGVSEPARRLIVRADAAPEVAIVTPTLEDAPDGEVDVTYTPWVRALAHDDIGLKQVSMVLARDGQQLRRALPLDDDKELNIALATSEFDVAVGETVRVWFEAVDGRERADGKPSAQLVRSRVLRLTRSALPPQPPAEPTPDGQGQDTPGDGGADGAQSQPGGTGDTSDGTDGGGEGGEAGRVGGSGSSPERQAPAGDTDASGIGGTRTDSQLPGPGDEPVVGGQGADEAPAGDAGDFEDELREFAEEFGEDLPVAPKLNDPGADAAPGAAEQDAAESSQEDSGPTPDDPKNNQEPPSDEDAGSDAPGADASAAEDQTGQQQGEPAGESPAEKSADTEDQNAQGRDDTPGDDPSEDDPSASDSDDPAPGQPPNDEAAGGNQARGMPKDAPREPAGSTDQPNDAEGGSRPPSETDAQPSDSVNPSEEPRADAAAEVGRVLDLLSDDADLGEDELVESGLTPERAREFVKRFERLRALAEETGVLGDARRWRSRATLGSGEVSRGGAGDPGVSSESDGGERFDDRLAEIVAPRDQRVAPELEAILEAYYRSIAERAARREGRADHTKPD